MQLFCNFSFVLFFQKGRALARISLFERSERDFTFLYFTFLFFVYLNAVLGEFFPDKTRVFGEIYYLILCCF